MPGEPDHSPERPGRGRLGADGAKDPTAEADAVLADYVRRHPRAWKRFKNILENTLGTAIGTHHTALPMVELSLDARRS